MNQAVHGNADNSKKLRLPQDAKFRCILGFALFRVIVSTRKHRINLLTNLADGGIIYFNDNKVQVRLAWDMLSTMKMTSKSTMTGCL